MFWRRLDAPGHDACRLERSGDGWELAGAAVFRENELPVWFLYRLCCDSAWRTIGGEVRGRLGEQRIELSIERTSGGRWTLDGTPVRGLEACVDLDLAFTPATNLTQLRRIRLAQGEAAEVPVAWLDVSARRLEILPQRYERRSQSTYFYEAPSLDYQGLLEVDSADFVVRYPGLWEAEL